MLYNTSGKTSKHPVVFEKAPVLFLKALDLFKNILVFDVEFLNTKSHQKHRSDSHK